MTAGQPLLTLHTDTPEKFDYALESLKAAYDIAPAGTAFTADPDRAGPHRLTRDLARRADENRPAGRSTEQGISATATGRGHGPWADDRVPR